MRKDMDKKYRGTRRPGPDFNGKMKKCRLALQWPVNGCGIKAKVCKTLSKVCQRGKVYRERSAVGGVEDRKARANHGKL